MKYSFTSLCLAVAIIGIGSIFLPHIREAMNHGNPRQAVFYLSAGVMYLAGLIGGACWKTSLYKSAREDEIASAKNIDKPKIIDDMQDDAFKKNDRQYPEELDIATQAWRAVRHQESSKQPKEQITDWLNATYPHLTTSAKDRIALVCNWNKKGGAPKTPG
ncbi:hypothetical protein ACXX82_06440 [Glaciimonas sp. GNP009]